MALNLSVKIEEWLHDINRNIATVSLDTAKNKQKKMVEADKFSATFIFEWVPSAQMVHA